MAKLDHVKQEEAHAKAAAATVKKFGPDYVGQEAIAYYNQVLQKELKKK